jgi:hypothetical protein
MGALARCGLPASAELVAEIGSLRPTDATGGYRSHFVYCIHDNPLHDSLYPPRIVLYRKQRAFYRNEGHGGPVLSALVSLGVKGLLPCVRQSYPGLLDISMVSEWETTAE